MLPILSREQRQSITEHGTPLPLRDESTGDTYLLLGIEFIPAPEEDGFTASIPGIAAYGEGGTEDEASLALCEALRAYMENFRGAGG